MKKILIAIGVLVGIFLVLGLVAPKDFHVEREVLINKPKETVFPHLKSLKEANSWGPWAKRDPNMKLEYRGQDGAVGSVLAWAGNSEVGEGEQEIKNIVEGERVDSELRFTKPFEDKSTTYFLTEAVTPTQTKVKWGMKGRSGFPLNILCMLMGMQKMIAKDFDEGLANLKAKLEQ